MRDRLVFSGSVVAAGTGLGAQGWGRLPAGVDLVAEAGSGGAMVWLKDAALQHADILPLRA